MTYKDMLIACWEYSDSEINRIIDDYFTMRYVEKSRYLWKSDYIERPYVERNEPSSEQICWYDAFVEWLNEYISHIPSAASYKQMLWTRVTKWAISVGNKMGIAGAQSIVQEEIFQPVCGDTSLSVIKELHSREGITKEELARRIGKTTKTVQNEISKLNPSTKYNINKDEVRICGQVVNVPISHWAEMDEITRRYKNKYITRNSLHPLFLQMNVMQTGTMLEALGKAYLEDERNLSRGIAIDIWCQLTDYGRERIKIAFPDSMDFWDELDDEMSGVGVPHFASEQELADEMSNREILAMYMKCEDDCNITLYEDGDAKKYIHYIIRYEQDVEDRTMVFVAKPNPFFYDSVEGMESFIISENDIFDIEKNSIFDA